MIILFTCNEANSQLVTEREAMKDALNTCLRPESFSRLENLKVLSPVVTQTTCFTRGVTGLVFCAREQQRGFAAAGRLHARCVQTRHKTAA